MTEPSRGYHGVRFYETFGDFGFTMKARMETMRTLGPTLSPLAAFLLLQGIETLHVRMPRHSESALAVAKHLAAHPAVEWVSYPGLPGGRYEALARRYLPRGAGGILTFGVKGGAKAGERFIEAVQFLSHLANVGDAKTLVIHPASTTHRQLSEDEQRVRRRDAGDDSSLDRSRDARRHPVGHRPGAAAITMKPRESPAP